MPIRPYGGEETRVVSDLSRFEYGKPEPRKRSRNTTPTSLPSDSETLEAPVTTDFYEHYATLLVSEEPIRQFAPYPPSIVENLPYNTPHRLHNPQPPLPPYQPYQNRQGHMDHLQQFKMREQVPVPPPKDSPVQESYKPESTFHDWKDEDSLPPMKDSRDYMKQRDSQATVVPDTERRNPQKTQLPENNLLERVMNRPVLTFGPKEVDPFDPQSRNFHFTASNVIDFFQIIFGVVIIALASTLGSQDSRISIGIYRYFIAVGVITLVVSLLFIGKAINFDRRNGVFYCLLACVLTGVSLILSITSVATNNNCESDSICQMRKALATFSILSFFLWLCMLVMFFTTLYISKMNLLEDVNFDYSRRGASQPQSRIPSQGGIPSQGALPQYFLDEKGDMYPLENHDTRGKKKIVVYA